MAPQMSELLDDLVAETRVVEGMLDPLSDAEWERFTPAEGWRIRDQVSHLAYFDQAAMLAAIDPERFRAEARELVGRGDRFTDEIAEQYRGLPRRGCWSGLPPRGATWSTPSPAWTSRPGCRDTARR